MTNEPTRMESMIDLIARRRSLFRRAEFLPGFDQYVAGNSDINKYLVEQWRLVDAAVRDDDVVRFEDASGSWLKGCHRVNELLAEAYRAANADPELWELRYIKWMKILFIRFDSKFGEFYLVPRRPRRRPKAKHWYTVEEMTGMILGPVGQLIDLSGQLPQRPEDVPPAVAGEKRLHMDFTGPTPVQYYEMGGTRWKNGTS